MDWPLIALSGFAFLAGFIDSIVGGGGLVQVPAFFVLYPQLSVPNIIGTNRVASAFGTSVAAINYIRSIKIPWKVVGVAALGSMSCSYLGAYLQSMLSAEVLKPIILVLIIAIAIYTFKKKDFGQEENPPAPRRLLLFAFLVGMVMGFYNGLIGPGTGSLLVFGFVRVTGYNLLRASGMAKIINVVTDVSSLTYFFIHKYILFHIALPMLVCNMAGAFLGSRLAILKGNQFVRIFFLVVIVLVILRFGWDVWKIFDF